MLKTKDVTVAIFVRALGNLKNMLSKTEAYIVENRLDPRDWLDAKLADDMFTLAWEAHWAAAAARLAVARLLGDDSKPDMDEPKTFADLYRRIDTTIAALHTVDEEALEAGLARTIEMRHRGGVMTYRGNELVTDFAIPNFFFHATAAYAILRHRGAPLQKGDFLG